LIGVEECYRGKSVRVFRRDQAATIAALRAAAQRLVAERDEVSEVWLFGSLAERHAGPASDADLLIVVNVDERPFVDRGQRLAPYFQGAGIGCDLFVYTAAEVASLRNESSIVRTALQRGSRLAARDADCS
jgi:predicted nucleotidyltransferase